MKKTILLKENYGQRVWRLKWTACCLLLMTFLLGQSMNAQTVLINPNVEGGFESGTTFADNGWTQVDDTNNRWVLGTVPGWFSGARGAYVSNDNGVTWGYKPTTTNRSHFYRDVAFPAGVTAVDLVFDWRGNGNDGNRDNLLVYIMDTNITPSTAGPITTNTINTNWTGYTNGTTGYYLLQRSGTSVPTTTTAVTYTFTTAQLNYVSGKTKRLVFVWKNDGSGGTNPPASLDNISLTATVPSCIMPVDVVATGVTENAATISWTASASAPASGYEYEIRTGGAAGSGATGLTTSGTTAAGIVTKSVTGLTPFTAYLLYVRANCGGGDFSTWTRVAKFRTSCDADISGTIPGSVCGNGSVTLGATATNGTLSWYAAATGGTALGTGATFATPVISATTSYWVEAGVPETESVGPVSPTAQGGTIGTQTTAWSVNFTVTENTTLVSVDVFPITSGQTGAIVLRNSTGVVIATYPYTTNVSGGATAQTVILNHALTPGNYQLYPTLPSAGLSRNTTEASYPYTSSMANITGNSFDPAYYMGFYNWIFQSVCTSPRTEVVATVTTAPEFTLSTNSTTAVCSGQAAAAVTIATGAANYDTFVWSPATGVTGNAANGWVFNPTATTTYTLTASQSAGVCAIATNVVVNINPLPVVTAATVNETICEGTSAALTALTVTPGTAAIGTGTTLTSATTQPTAFCNRWSQYWNQTVYTAAELTAAGLRAGNITSIAYNITTLGNAANVTNFTIRIGTTANSTLTGFTTTGLNLVYGPATYAHAIGVNTITFATPYAWDGVSNIIVDVRQEGVNLTNNAVTYYTATTGNKTASAVTTTLPTTFILAETNPTASLSVQRLNVVFGGQVVSTGAGILDWTWTPGNLTGSTVTVSPTTATTYTVRGTNPATGCYTEATVMVNVTTTPPPTGNSTQTINVNTAAEATIEDIVVTGTAVVWYPTAADALANTNPIAAGTQLVSGTTYYAVQTVGGCRSVSPLAVTVTVTLGTSSFEITGLKYYPNPVAAVFTITYTDAIASVEVFNLIGQRVIAEKPATNTVLLDMSVLPAGAYIVQVKANGQSQSIKVVKK